MSIFGSAISTIISQATSESDENFEKSIAEFKMELNAENAIRLFVAGSNGYGHQSTTIHIMMRLIYGFEYSNNIEVYYEEKNGADKSTKQKLIDLIPELTENNFEAGISIGPQGKEASVKFILYGPKPTETKEFGFTGGADDREINYAETLNTTYFLRLQPLNWREAPNQIEFLDAEKNAVVLDTIVGKNYFYGPSTLVEEDWVPMIESASGIAKTRIELAQVLFTKLKANHILLMPVYGIRDDGKMQVADGNNADVFMFSLLAPLLSLAQEGNVLNKKVVVVSFGSITNETFNQVVSGCKTFLTEQAEAARNKRKEIDKNKHPSQWNSYNRKALSYVKSTKLSQGFIEYVEGLYVEETTTVTQLNDLLNNNLQKVLYLQLGGVPAPVFDYFYSKATLPTVFEGQGTAAKAYCYGLPYLQLPKASVSHKYPQDLVGVGQDGYLKFASATEAIFDAFPSEITLFVKTKREAETYSEDKVKILSDFMKDTLSLEDNVVKQYIQLLKNTYGSESEDKLLLGIVELKKQLPVLEVVQAEFALASVAPAAEETRLEHLLGQLNQAMTPQKTLNLLDALSAGGMKTFYSKIVNDHSFLLTNAAVNPVYDTQQVLTKITVTGETNSFGLPITVKKLDFTSLPAALLSHGEYVASDTKWELEGAPWIGLNKPGFAIDIFDNPAPISGAVFASLNSPPARLSLAFPTKTNGI